MDKTVDMLKYFGAVLLSVQNMRWRGLDIQEYPLSERGYNGTEHPSQRDQTTILTEVENVTFLKARKNFLRHLYQRDTPRMLWHALS